MTPHRSPVFRSLIVAAIVAVALPAAAEVIPLGPEASGVRYEAIEGGDELLVVTVSELRLDSIEIDGEQWAVARVPGGHNLMERGYPTLPFLASEYLLEATGGIDVELVEAIVRTIDLDAYGFAGVAPSKGHFKRTVDPDTVPWVFNDKVYGADVDYPAAAAWVDQPYIAGPLRGQALRFPVASWRAGSNRLTVIEEARYRIVYHSDDANPRLRPQPPMSGLFDAIARHRMVNYQQHRLPYGPFVEAGRLLIVADDDFLDEIQPLADWQTLVGFPTLVTPTSVTGSTNNEIKAYIQGVYDEPEGLSWIILVGDSAQIPTLTGVNSQHSPCDACYTKLEGADNRPDAAISRISATIGDQVTTQVAKILGYEQLPDTGSAGAWYSAGFGIGSDDTGGTGLADWERVELLRVDLMVPNYTYTEFDQIYHDSSTASQVTNAVEAGRSLGLYIGHGSSTSWGTTYFNVGDVHNLTNGEMLPTIWSVACNNGEFTVGECFGEAWLREDQGGAVSFEGGTTSEAWVPPCDAQRGIVDALRLEAAFTTGGQHMSGKHYVMDVHGDGNNSEGNAWVEQSALFGACTTWMRTLPAVPPDEPDDFNSAGGIATLTVNVAGQPLAKAGAAIVSFYTEDGGLDLVGAGLIDDTGVVHAEVSGDPTHCHIHGQNLVPQSFELAAREDGRVSLDAAAYTCDATVGIRVSDSNVPGSSNGTIDTVDVTLSVPGDSTPVTLTETGADRNIYTGTATLGSDLVVSHGQTLTVSYVDADDGAGGINVTKTADAAIDCAGPEVVAGPAITEIGATSALVSWTTDEPGTSVAETAPGGLVFSDDTLVEDHALVLTGLDDCTAYRVTVSSVDGLGNPGTPALSAEFITWELTLSLEDDMESGPGDWTVDTATGGGTTWTLVTSGSHSPSHSWFSSDEGAVKDDRLMTGPYTLGGGTTTLDFWHSHDTENGWDGGVLEISTDGVGWQDVTAFGSFVEGGYSGTLNTGYNNPIEGRSAWTGDSGGFIHTTVELTGLAGSDIWFRFRIGCDSMVGDVGWWVDDVRLMTTAECTPANHIFGDGFESGDCTMWSVMVE